MVKVFQLKVGVFLVMASLLVSCSYRWGYRERALPGGYRQVAIPVFSNKSQVVGIEGYFTNEMIRQFARSKVASVVGRSLAPVIIEGSIRKVEFIHGGQIIALDSDERQAQGDNASNFLPDDAVLTTDYRVLVTTMVSLRRQSDRKVLWSGLFRNEKVYSAPQITLPIVNSANPLYNHSARHENIALIAGEMMAEVHERITENF